MGRILRLFVLMLMRSMVALFVAKPEKIYRNDGSRVLIPRQTSFWTEIKNLPLAIKCQPLIVLFFPYAFVGLWYIPYQSNDFNGYFFDLRNRGFASLWYDFEQFAMEVDIGYLPDLKALSRRERAFLGWTVLLVLANAVFVGGVFPMRESHRGVAPMKLLSGGSMRGVRGILRRMYFMDVWMVLGRLLVRFLLGVPIIYLKNND
jgi:hypothetical protein